MELLSGNCLTIDYTTSIISPRRQISPVLVDEDSGLGMEMDCISPKPNNKNLGNNSRSHALKRLFDDDLEQLPSQKSFKRHKSFDVSREKRPFLIRNIISPISMVSEDDVTNEDISITDERRTSNSLPTVQGKHQDLNSISADTMREVLSGDHADTVGHVTIIDCRYPYEFQGGHIKNAVNIYTKDGIDDFLKENQPTLSKHVLIFHCEFSSKRGPKLCRFLRNRDREMNKDNYPKLNFQEIYLLEGGYKEFFESNSDLCFPQAYKPMLDKRHSSDLRHFRVKSKSWAAGDKPKYERTGLQRMKLSFN